MLPLVQDLLRYLKNNKIPYGDLNTDLVLKDISKTYRDINIIIGIRGRANFLPVCIKYFKKAEELVGFKICITIVEHDINANYRDLCKKLGVDYIYVSDFLTFSKGTFNRSFCFNVGYLLTKPSTWYLFHDIDILVNRNFFNNLAVYINKNPKWVQTYTHKRVLLLDQDITNALISAEPVINLYTISRLKPSNPGSTGGSILVRDDVFRSTGGFDPEFFYGYGPEDSFFWSKLEVINKPVNVMSNHFCGGGVFADDPPIEVFHMYHEPMWHTNPDENFMLYIRECFWKYNYSDKLKIIQEKEKILNEAITLLSP